jgi:hypothetical protein
VACATDDYSKSDRIIIFLSLLLLAWGLLLLLVFVVLVLDIYA